MLFYRFSLSLFDYDIALGWLARAPSACHKLASLFITPPLPDFEYRSFLPLKSGISICFMLALISSRFLHPLSSMEAVRLPSRYFLLSVLYRCQRTMLYAFMLRSSFPSMPLMIFGFIGRRPRFGASLNALPGRCFYWLFLTISNISLFK